MTLKINQLRDCRSVFTAVAAAFVFSAGPGTLASEKADVIYPQMDEVVVQATSGEVLAFGPFRQRGHLPTFQRRLRGPRPTGEAMAANPGSASSCGGTFSIFTRRSNQAA